MAALAALVSVALIAAERSDAAGFGTGFGDSVFLSSGPGERDTWLNRVEKARGGVVRLNVSWRAVAQGKPADPTDPNDPAYHFAAVDAAVSDIVAHGLEPLLTLFAAPGFAEGPGPRPNSAAAGTWKPDPQAFGDFAKAVARRYSGSMGLPRVRYFQAWNEANLDVYLSPQWDANNRQFAAGHYSRMLRAFHRGVKGVSAGNIVITAGTAPYGEPPGGHRTRPFVFITRLLCLDTDLDRLSCPVRPRFDVLAHHPITTSGGPRTSALHPFDITIPDIGVVADALRAAERKGTLAGKRHPLWVTEFWWETDPPDRCTGVAPARQARWIADAFYLLWREGVRLALYFQIVDTPFDEADCGRATFQTGIYTAAGNPKQSARAFRFPLVVNRLNRRKVFAWLKAPRRGKVRIQRKTRGGGWETIATENAKTPGVETLKFRLRGGEKLRAVVGSEKSIVRAT